MNAPLPSQAMALPDDQDNRADDYAEVLYDEDRTSKWALASQMDWLWYSDHEKAHDPDATAALELIATGADDAELGRIIRTRTLHELWRDCEKRAEQAVKTRDDEAAEARAESRMDEGYWS